MTNKITDEHRRRVAIVYIRQSSPGQVQNNLESQRRQYDLAERARTLGFVQVEVIDDDLGKSGSGKVHRPGYQRMIGEVAAGTVGAVFCIEASRLARNGREWHTLIDLCGLMNALVVDPDGIYDPKLVNDRLLLGLKGSLSEYELSLLRQRSHEAIRAKASRGELQFPLPVGFEWSRDGRVVKSPDSRVQAGINRVFETLHRVGSARQTLMWFTGENVEIPAITYGEFGRALVWKLPIYNSILRLIKNPLYAGAYAWGQTESRTTVTNGRARKSAGHRKHRDSWDVLLLDHHPSYISWEAYEKNQRVLQENSYMKGRMAKHAGRGGACLLAGLMRCRRCGRMLHVAYCGGNGSGGRYECRGAMINHGQERCISFGNVRVDRAVGEEVLRAVEPDAIEAAILAAERLATDGSERVEALQLQLRETEYAVRLAERRYVAVDPDQRLVAAELERRWNEALSRVMDIHKAILAVQAESRATPTIDKRTLLQLAAKLPALWRDATTDMQCKQRVVRTLVREVVVDVDKDRNELDIVIHWVGGRHTPLRVRKNRSGEHRNTTSFDAKEVIKRMAGGWSDEQIAATLNRLGLRSGKGNTWNELRVRSHRSYHKLPGVRRGQRGRNLTMQQAAKRLEISASSIRRLLSEGTLRGIQPVPAAPWAIPEDALGDDGVVKAVAEIRGRRRTPRRVHADPQIGLLP